MPGLRTLHVFTSGDSPFARAREAGKLVLGEGSHEGYLLSALLRLLNKRDIQPAAYGGKNRLQEALEYLVAGPPSPGAGDLRSVGITRDANGDFHAAWQAVLSALRNANEALAKASADAPLYSTPDEPGIIASDKAVRVGVFILPDNQSPGMMETLCVRSVEALPQMDCVKSFFACLGTIEGWPQPKKYDKALAHAFLATCERPDIHPGLACGDDKHDPDWQFDHEAFEGLKAFIGKL